MGSKKHKEKIWNLIKNIEVGMINYPSSNGIISKPLQLIQESYDNRLWFLVDRSSTIYEEFKDGKLVSLSFSDISNNIYVSLRGEGYILESEDLIDKFWNNYVSAWFEKKSDAALIEVRVRHGEHWDVNVSREEFDHEVANAVNSEETPNVEEHAVF